MCIDCLVNELCHNDQQEVAMRALCVDYLSKVDDVEDTPFVMVPRAIPRNDGWSSMLDGFDRVDD